MNTDLYISSYCKIKDAKVFLNGNIIADEDTSLSFADFAKKVYKDNVVNYPKFFKMDSLCKLAFLGAEFIFRACLTDSQESEITENTAVVLSNNASSLDTDRKHQEAIQDAENYFPSPAVFVYTLPNIAIGEISIKHKLKSENAFFVSEAFNEKLLHNYTTVLVENNKANSVLCGWVNYDEGAYEAFLVLVSRKGTEKFTTEKLRELYQN